MFWYSMLSLQQQTDEHERHWHVLPSVGLNKRHQRPASLGGWAAALMSLLVEATGSTSTFLCLQEQCKVYHKSLVDSMSYLMCVTVPS